jgi:hypothetical protein
VDYASTLFIIQEKDIDALYRRSDLLSWRQQHRVLGRNDSHNYHDQHGAAQISTGRCCCSLPTTCSPRLHRCCEREASCSAGVRFTFLAQLNVVIFTVSSTCSKPVLLSNVDIAPEDIDEEEYSVEITSQLLSLAFLASK